MAWNLLADWLLINLSGRTLVHGVGVMRREGALGICEDNIKVELKETVFEDMDWICFLAQNMVQ
jgi:hypothetical protein